MSLCSLWVLFTSTTVGPRYKHHTAIYLLLQKCILCQRDPSLEDYLAAPIWQIWRSKGPFTPTASEASWSPAGATSLGFSLPGLLSEPLTVSPKGMTEPKSMVPTSVAISRELKVEGLWAAHRSEKGQSAGVGKSREEPNRESFLSAVLRMNQH